MRNGGEVGRGPETERKEYKIGWAGSWARCGRSREKKQNSQNTKKKIKLKKNNLSALLILK